MTHTMRCITLLASVAILASVSANTDSDNERKFLNRFEKSLAEINKQIKDLQKGNNGGYEYTNEFPMTKTRDKREASPTQNFVRRERSASPKDSVMQINLVSFHKPESETKRVKRATFNTTTATWPRHIPYVFNESYPMDLRPKVKRIMQEIMDNLCITWTEEPNFDPANNTYETNAYLHFVGSTSNVCGAFVGQGAGINPRDIKTCSQYYTIAHELLHTLGVIHEQQGPLAPNHLSLALQNVAEMYYGGTYRPNNVASIFETSEMDATSIMMYSRRAFSLNGLDILLPFREDELLLNHGHRPSLDNNLQELNKVYRCQELECAEDGQVDCGLGYYTKVKGVCRCVCPNGFDSHYNCQKLDDETSGPTDWPDVDFTMYANEQNVCPEGFTAASFDITGTRTAQYFYEPFPSTGRTTNYYMCTRSSTGNDMEKMPMGTYCMVKPVGTDCNGAFTEGGYVVKTNENFTYSGDYGDWEIQDDPMYVKMKFCCREDREVHYIMDVPRKTGFSLISENGQCSNIEGMRYAWGLIVMFVQGSTRYNPPQSWLASYYLIHGFCRYTPADYGCNEQVTLDRNNPNQSFKTPGFDANSRTTNKRCLYNFNVPKGARIKVTIHEFDLDSKDQFNVRRFNKWSLPQYDFPSKFKRQFISEKDFMLLEWWSGRNTASKKGVHFTAEVLLEEDSCHSVVDRGMSYKGAKDVTENFEDCLPWSEAANCADFPFYGSESLSLMSHSYCRNPGGAMERPWCYVSVDRLMCRKAYCDVCNNLEEKDQITSCQALKDADPNFCSNPDYLQRTKCSEACNLGTNVDPPVSTVVCGTPPTPYDGTPSTGLKSGYSEGEIVSFTCNIRHSQQQAIEIACTSNGWPTLSSACTECPTGWVPYGDRCFFFSPDYKFVDEADAYCESMGARLFEIRDKTDLDTIRNFKQTSTIDGAYGSSWVNTIMMPDGNWTLYDDNSKHAPQLEWAADCVLNDFVDHGCAVMIWENDNTGNAGKFNSTSCNLANSRTFCEIDRVIPTGGSCSDSSLNCPEALSHDPSLCDRTNSYQVAASYCQESCGACANEDNLDCTDPLDSTYTRISPNATIPTGFVMEFSCNAGLYLVSGDLQRACGYNGEFLGDEPECSDTPTDPESVGASGVLPRIDIMPTNKIFLLDIDGFRIPFSGNVTHWHYYGVKPGAVFFVVYRHDDTTGQYTMTGYNQISVTYINERWTSPVPQADQIVVQKGDIYGMFTIDGSISATSCENRDKAVMVLRHENANSMDASMIGTESAFSGTSCYVPSVGLVVHPCKYDVTSCTIYIPVESRVWRQSFLSTSASILKRYV